MPVDAIRIEERLWSSASPLRRQEWRTLLADIAAIGPLWPSLDACALTVGEGAGHLRFVFTSSSGSVRTLTLAWAEIEPVLSEYLRAIDGMSEGGVHPARLEALDMAKRVIHDAGARRLGELLPDLSPSREARRRFFSLIVSLAVDTTRAGSVRAVHAHGRIDRGDYVHHPAPDSDA